MATCEKSAFVAIFAVSDVRGTSGTRFRAMSAPSAGVRANPNGCYDRGMAETWTGGCQCGAVRYEIESLGRASVCHCRMCQRAFGNAFAPLVSAHGLRWLNGEPKRFRSSNQAQRGFCPHCGTPLTYEPDGLGIEVAIATLDDPSRVPPVIQMGTESRLPWCETIASLPTRTPEEAERVAPFYAGVVSFQRPR